MDCARTSSAIHHNKKDHPHKITGTHESRMREKENKIVEDKTIVNNGDEAVVAQDGVEPEDVTNQQIGETVRPGGAAVYENRGYTEAEANSMDVMMARRTGGDGLYYLVASIVERTVTHHYPNRIFKHGLLRWLHRLETTTHGRLMKPNRI
jgi:hypothetical protein